MDRFDWISDERLRQRAKDLADGLVATATPQSRGWGALRRAWDLLHAGSSRRPSVLGWSAPRELSRIFRAQRGLVLVAATVAALIWANSPIASAYERFVNTPLRIGSLHTALTLSVAGWCSEGLLALFFFHLGTGDPP
jgi:hypothetical protein